MLSYTRGTRITRLLRVRNYLNNYFAMFTRLTYSRICVELASPAYLGLGIIQIAILPCIPADALPYTRGTCISRLLGDRYYLKNYLPSISV